jgi:hypothetical protein
LGWATITHPFHPLRRQRFEVLKTRKVGGIDTLIFRHPQLGSYAVSQEWTDWRIPDISTWLDAPARKLDAGSLLELAMLLASVAARSQEGVDE